MLGDDAALKAKALEQAAQAVRPPRMMTKQPVQVQMVAGTNNVDGKPVVVLLISSSNGDFGFPLDPDASISIGEGLIASGRQAKSGLIL